jgi:AbrB family looped-hinge helix DNA binding protein
MPTATSRLNKKYQATIPKPVREILELRPGDAVVFEIHGKEIRLRKADRLNAEWPEALESTLTEWSGDADEQAYRDL